MYALVKFLVKVYFHIVYNIRFEGRKISPRIPASYTPQITAVTPTRLL